MSGNKLRVLQIGAGSMGKRRMRDAVRCPEVALAVYDERPDRRAAAAEAFGISAFTTLAEAMAWQPQAMVISTPPDQHAPLVELAVERGLHHFCEASIWTPDWRRILRASEENRLVSARSSSLHFHPLIAGLKQMAAADLGTLHAYQFCLATFMPDWHPGEGNEFYARHRSTSAGREMVPFELLWLNEVFGFPLAVSGALRQCAALGDELEDSWCLQIDLEGGAVGQLSVFMGCPTVLRRGWCIGANGVIEFDLWRGIVKRRLQGQEESTRSFGSLPDLVDAIYQRETNAFFDAVLGTAPWPMSYRAAGMATATLAAAELSALSACKEKVDPDRQPALVPTAYAVQTHDLDMTARHGLGGPCRVQRARERHPL